MPPDPDLVASRPGKWRPSTGRRLAERPQLCVSSDSANFPYLRNLGFISDSTVRDSTCPPRYSQSPHKHSSPGNVVERRGRHFWHLIGEGAILEFLSCRDG